MKDFPFRAILGFLGLVWFVTLRLAAQQLAVLNIAVTDPTGSVISHAKVTLRSTETEAKRTDFSSGAGLAADTVYGTPAFLGPVSRKFGGGVSSPANPTFGSLNFVASARQVQISLRLNF